MTQDTMKALVLHGIGDLRYEQVPVPKIAPGEVLVRVVAAGICGSDLPRVFEHGAYHYPLIPGHEFSGVVVKCGHGVEFPIGMSVVVKPLIPCGRCDFCRIGAFAQCVAYDYLGSRRDGGFAEYVAVPAENLVPLPAGLSLCEAALTEPVAVALHALQQGDVHPGDSVAILGCGPIGMILAQWARIRGAGRIMLIDVDSPRLAMAQKLWLGDTCDARQQDPVDWVMGLTGGRGADLVIEAAGVPRTVAQSILMARPLGRVVVLGNPSGEVSLSRTTMSQILRKELTIKGSWNSRFVSLPVDEWQVAVSCLATRRVTVRELVSHRIPLAQGVQMFRRMFDHKVAYARVLLIMDEKSE